MANTTHPPRTSDAAGTRQTPPHAPGRRGGLRTRLAGGTAGNERLTVLTGLLLIVLFAGMGVTILRIGQLLWLHLFLGLTLAGPVALKLISAGYRFTRYYLGDRRYRRRGTPPIGLRMLAPLLVLCTFGVLATGLTLLLLGPSARQPVLLLHKLFFFAWLAVFGLHVLAHLPDVLRVSSISRRARSAAPRPVVSSGPAHGLSVPGARARVFALGTSLVLGLALATALTGQFHVWTG